jgi:hypothetical protein
VSDELKKCPFCGADEAKLYSFNLVHNATVRCENCHIRTPEFAWDEGAVFFWNRRAQPTIPEIPARTPPIDPDLLESGEETKR